MTPSDLASAREARINRRNRAVSSAVEHWFYTPLVGSSILSPPTSLRSRSERRLPRRSPKGEGGLVAASFGLASQAGFPGRSMSGVA